MPETKQPAAGGGRASTDSNIGDAVVNVLLLPVTVLRQALPDNEVPVLLGAAALAVVDVIDWPVAAAAGLGYAAWRRLRPKRKTG
ncbi:MAG: hypothetical protein ACYCO3_01860 [Mycobacteriales bacterium]